MENDLQDNQHWKVVFVVECLAGISELELVAFVPCTARSVKAYCFEGGYRVDSGAVAWEHEGGIVGERLAVDLLFADYQESVVVIVAVVVAVL